MNRFLNLKTLSLGLLLIGLVALFYWLLPVAASSRLSADHVRWAMGNEDIAPTVAMSLSSFWAVAISALGGLASVFGGLSPSITFSTAAGLSAWVSILAIGILALNVSWPALLLAVLAPTFLWTAVVPNGTAIVFLLLALMSVLSKPSITFLDSPRRWTLGAVIDGVASSLSPAAWILVLLRAVHSHEASSLEALERRRRVGLRLLLFVVGFSLHFVVGLILDQSGSSSSARFFSVVPAMELLRSLRGDDVLSAGVAFLGGGGESVMSLLAALNLAVAITVSKEWQTRASLTGLRPLALKATASARWALLVSPFFVLFTAGQISSWRVAHPGANTVVEDFGRNLTQSFPAAAVAFVNSATEEAGVRYVREIYSQGKKLAVLRPLNVFDPSTEARVTALVPSFSLAEAKETATNATTAQGAANSFFDLAVAPNLRRGISMWLEATPEISGPLEQGLEINFLGNGFKLAAREGSTRILASKEDLREAYVRFRPTAREFSPRRSLEIKIFERYAAFHLGLARIIEFEKATKDWERRARGEYYAALKKVEWYPALYDKVCAAALPEISPPGPVAKSPPTSPPEPLDVCVDTAWYHRP